MNLMYRLYEKLYNFVFQEKLDEIAGLEINLADKSIELDTSIKSIKKLEDNLTSLQNDLKELQFDSADEVYWNNRRPKADIYYRGRTIPQTTQMINVDVKTFLMPNDSEIHYDLKKHGLYIKTVKACNEEILKIYKHTRTKKINPYKYIYDKDNLGLGEFWMFPFELRAKGKGDCVANYEEIYTENGLTKVGELKENDKVLSYDWNKKEYCYKPIIKIWEKGKLPIKRVYLRNGTHIDVTENHPLWSRINANGESKYEKSYLSDIDLTKWYKRKLPIANKIPYKVKDIEWLNEDLCFIIGHYIAEGFKYKNSHVRTCGYDVPTHIIPLLEKLNIPFTEYKNNSGVPVITFLKSDFKEYLKLIKENSFDIHLPEELFSLPENKIRKILEGYLLGDGYIDKRDNNNEFIYNTVSDKLMEDLNRLHLQLGEPLYNYYQLNHMGVGKTPIWRIHYNKNSLNNRDYGYNGLSETGIVSIEDLDIEEVRDFQVQDTATFFFKNGLCSHNCDDWSHELVSYLIAAGVPEWRVRVVCGMTYGGFGHSTVYVLADNMETWIHCNSTTPIHMIKATKLMDLPHTNDLNDRMGIKNVWFSFNTKFAWHSFETSASEDDYEKESKKLFKIEVRE